VDNSPVTQNNNKKKKNHRLACVKRCASTAVFLGLAYILQQVCARVFKAGKFDKLVILTSSLLLVLPGYSKHFEVVCNAPLTDMGAVLIQEGRLAAVHSKKLPLAEHDSSKNCLLWFLLLPRWDGLHDGR